MKGTQPAGVPAHPDLSLVMPCYNEESCIWDTASDLAKAFAKTAVQLEIVLVDNGSTDGTGAVIDGLIADGYPIRKVSVDVNQGYGHGILSGLEQCRAPVIGYLCADGQVAAEDVVRTYGLMAERQERVLAKVRRRFRQDSWRRRIVSIIYNGMMLGTFGWLGAIDINGSPKIFSRRVFRAMKLRSRDWFLDPEIMIKAKRLGLRTIEIDVEGYARRSGISHVRRQTILEFLKNIWRYRTGPYLNDWFQSIEPALRVDSREDPIDEQSTDDLFGRVRVIEQRRFEDSRGFLQKILTASQCEGPPPAGEVYVTAAKPGEAKGNHYHRGMGEWFSIVLGEGSVHLCDPTTGERRQIPLDTTHPRTVFVPAGLAHAVVNTGLDQLICIAWAEAEHDPKDVYPFPVWPVEPSAMPVEVNA